MNKIVRIVFILLTGLVILSCPAPNDGGRVSFSWTGTWASNQTFNERGTFSLTAVCAGGSLTGRLVLRDRALAVTLDEDVTGSAEEEYDSYGHIEFSMTFGTTGGGVTFAGSSNSLEIEDLPEAPFIVGTFVSGGDTGNWHTAPDGLTEECVIESVVQTSPALSILDLCSDGTTLYAVADTGSAHAVYNINPTTGVSTLLTGLCDEPVGIAHDGSRFYIVNGNPGDGYDLYAYDGSWSPVAGYPKAVTGMLMSSIGAIGFHDGAIVCPAFFCLDFLDPDTAQLTAGSGLMLRSSFAEGDGTRLWTTYLAPGYDWSSLDECSDAAGAVVVRRLLSPDPASAAFAFHGGFLWTASLGGGLYKISVD